MNIFRQGKFPLSNTAMKIAARSLQKTSDHPNRSRIAIRRGLRNDAECVFEVSRRDQKRQRIDIGSALTWISGCCGSGKGELVHGAARYAARKGRTLITITADNTLAWRWHDDDRVVVDLRDIWPVSDELFMSRIAPHMEDIDLTNLIILVPVLCKLPDTALSEFDQLFANVIDHLPNGSLLIVDELYPECAWSPQLAGVRRALSRTESSAMIASQYLPSEAAGGLLPGESLLTMRMCHSPGLNVPHRELDAGEGYLHVGEAPIPIFGDYEYTQAPPHVLPEPALRAIGRLEKYLKENSVSGHIAHLEAVARACGYRSWHAAQGRKNG